MKRYFYDSFSEYCYPLPVIKEMMKSYELTKKKVFEAVSEKLKGFFWCNEFCSVTENGSCGTLICNGYYPKNKKSGCCKHRKGLYSKGEKRTVKICQYRKIH